MSKRKRQSFSYQLKSEIANAYASGKLTAKEIEAKGIRMGNVHRWVHEFVPADGAVVETAPAAELNNHKGPPSSETGVSDVVDVRQLTKRQLKRGANGRYDKAVKASVMKALDTMTVPEIAEITGITEATLYLWKNAPKKKGESASPGTSLVPAVSNGNGHDKSPVPAVRQAELLVNPATTDALLVGIRKSEGFANLEKAVKQLKAAHRAGLIEDYDEIDLRVLLGHRQLTGGGLRSRK